MSPQAKKKALLRRSTDTAQKLAPAALKTERYLHEQTKAAFERYQKLVERVFTVRLFFMQHGSVFRTCVDLSEEAVHEIRDKEGLIQLIAQQITGEILKKK